VEVVRELNRAYALLPFSHEYDGVLDQCPFQADWSVGPNLPIAWKGGAAGLFGDEIALVGGTWMPGYKKVAYAYHIKTQKYSEIPPPPFQTEYGQGVGDGERLYLISGRVAGGRVAMLHRAVDGQWQWTEMPSLPKVQGKGRWLAEVGVVPGKWLFIVGGIPGGKFIENVDAPPLPDLRLRLDQPGAGWEAMAPYPGGRRSFFGSAVVRGKLYVFGGSYPHLQMRSIQLELLKKHGLLIVPFQGVPDYRDAYRYDPETNTWDRLRNAPLSGTPGVVLEDRYVILMGNTQITHSNCRRVGRSNLAEMDKLFKTRVKHFSADVWAGYGDQVLVYDVEKDNYSRLGVMLYGVATVPWVTDGQRLYGFGGEPFHFANGEAGNTENVLQIATLSKTSGTRSV
jgi:hypothetical protein